MDLKIENFSQDLLKLCDSCRKANKCVDHSKICMAKRLTWNLAKVVYKKRKKKGLITDDVSC